MYHRINTLPTDPWQLCVTPANFEEHLQILHKKKSVISLPQLTEQWENKKLLNNSVVLTFDDGYADNFYNAKPLLEKYGIPATFFLTTGKLVSQKEFWWDVLETIFLQKANLPRHFSLTINDQLVNFDLGDEATLTEDGIQKHSNWTADKPPATRRCLLYYEVWKRLKFIGHEIQEKAIDDIKIWAGLNNGANDCNRCITADELMTFSKNDLFHFGAHTQMHQALATLNYQQQKKEIEESKLFIKQSLQKEVPSFAYPYGNYNNESIEILKQLNYKVAVTTEQRTINQKTDKFRFGRFHVKNINGVEFEKKLSGWKRY